MIAGGESTPPASSGGGADWLSDLRAGGGEIESSGDQGSFESGDVSDWLSRLGQVEESPAAPGKAQPVQGDALPDWLAAPSEKGDPNVPDWMEELGINPSPPAPPASKPSPPPAKPSQPASKPLQSVSKPSQPPAGPFQPAARQEEEDVPDWLRSLGRQDAPASPVQPSSASQQETPDWLSSIGAGQSAEAFPAEDSGSLPDWLSNLAAATDPGPAAPPPKQPDPSDRAGQKGAAFQTPAAREPALPSEPGVPDWLNSFKSPEPADAPPPEESSSGLPDWLSNLAAATDSGLAVQPAKQADLPDWFSQMGAASTPAASEPAQEADQGGLDWLSQMGAASTPAAQEPAQEADQGGLDWFSQLGAASTPAAQEPAQAADQDGLDWLSQMGSAPTSPAASEPVDQGGLDWLSSIKSTEPAQTPPAEESSTGLPDWFANLASSAASGPAAPPAKQADLPDWLSQMGAATETPATQEPASPPAQAAPDWLSQFSTEPAPPAQEQSGDDWLSQFGQRAFGAPEETSPAEKAEASPPAWFADQDGALFDALRAGAESSAEEKPLTESKPAAGSDWLSNLGDSSSTPSSTPAFIMDDESANWFGDEQSPAVGDTGLSESPDWLSQVSPDQASDEALTEGEGESPAEALAAADMPSWLEAMRPVEAIAPDAFKDASDTHVENSGPLSGLRGVLRAEPEVGRIRRPPPLLSKLELSAAHQSRVESLETLLAAEGKAKPVAVQPPVRPQVILRLLIAVILILATLWGLVWSGAQQVSLPDRSLVESEMTEVVAVRGMVEMVSNAPVLVSFDYEPALSAEMNAIGGVVVTHLQEKNAFLTMVSTSPLGPALADQMINYVQAQRGITYTNVTNLGYIPGGAGGLLSFAKYPHQTIPYSIDSTFTPISPFTSNSDKGWASPALRAINTVADFALVVVITDNADTARAWVEQVRPTLDADTRLVMLVSAQAEPFVRPYYSESIQPDKQQVSGLLAGILGGVAYQSLRGVESAPWKTWDALAISSLAAALMIVLGGVFNLFAALFARSRRAKSGA